jgi:NADP-dependent aldehyde dehydrogenase
MIDQIFQASTAAFHTYKSLSSDLRADFLEKIAEIIETNRSLIVPIAVKESNLPEGRINGELGRTTGQIKLFATMVREGSWLEAVIDSGDLHRTPMPKPDIRKMLTPIGPIVVFGASNFPLAFSTAGGDTISALAAGCPVIYKGHPAHPETSRIVAECIQKAVVSCGLPEGVFIHVEGGVDIGQALIQHPDAKGVAFTGSHKGGKALFDLANQRDEPIPVYAEMGSVNPIVVFPEKLANELVPLAETFVNSLTLGSGQFCTSPGLIFVPSVYSKAFETAAAEQIRKIASTPMLHPGIAQSYYESIDYYQTRSELNWIKYADPKHLINVSPALASISASDWLMDNKFQEEVFGSFALVVVYEDMEQLLEVAKRLKGQLTITIWGDISELKENSLLLSILEEKCGRILFTGVPTGVEVGYAMQHGGPYPATTDSRSTSVGAGAIKRFARPIAFQDTPFELLPDALRNENPMKIVRQVNGKYTIEKIK